MRHKICVLAAGFGGNSQAVRYMEGLSEQERSAITYIGMDTNDQTLWDVEADLRAIGVVDPVLFPLPAADGRCEGSKFNPRAAWEALTYRAGELAELLCGFTVVLLFLGFGKGTGEGTALLATEIALKSNVRTFVVITVPQRPQPFEKARHREVLRQFQHLGVRPIVIDSAALRFNLGLKRKPTREGLAELDKIVGHALRGGLMPILQEGSQIDPQDVDAFVFGQGYQVPVFGTYQRPTEPEAANAEDADRAMTRATKEALKASWQAATPRYYARGSRVELAMISFSGDWTAEEEDMVEQLALTYHKRAPGFKPIRARFQGPAGQNRKLLSFSVLYAAEPEEKVDSKQVAVWQIRLPEISESAAVQRPRRETVAPMAAASGSMTQLPAAVVETVAEQPKLPAPVVVTAAEPAPPAAEPIEEAATVTANLEQSLVTVEQLHETVFRGTIDPARINFSGFMSGTKGTASNTAVKEITLKLLGGSPARLEALIRELIAKYNGKPEKFNLDFAAYESEFKALTNPEVLPSVSEEFKLDILAKAKGANMVFAAEFPINNTSGRETRVSIRVDESELDDLLRMSWEETSKNRLRAFKYLRQLLGPMFVGLTPKGEEAKEEEVVVAKAAQNGNGGSKGFRAVRGFLKEFTSKPVWPAPRS